MKKNWKEITIAVLAFLLLWGGSSNYFGWNEKTIIKEVIRVERDTITVRDTVTKPTLVRDTIIKIRDKFITVPIKWMEPVQSDSIKIQLPKYVYRDTIVKDSILFAYQATTSGYLDDLIYSIDCPSKTVHIDRTKTIYKDRTFQGFATLGISKRANVGFAFALPKYMFEVNWSPIDNSIEAKAAHSIFKF